MRSVCKAHAGARAQEMQAEVVPDPGLTGEVQGSGQSEQVSPTLLGFQQNADSGSSHYFVGEQWLA